MSSESGKVPRPGEPRVGLVVLTLDAAKLWPTWARYVAAQTVCCHRRLVVDSSSSDDTLALATRDGFETLVIPRDEFDHGATRQLAAEALGDVDILVYLTQDAMVLRPDALARLLEAFEDPRVALAYGRQVPRSTAGFFEAFPREFNYPIGSFTRSLDDREVHGVKTVFCSNSFAAYRRNTLMAVGGFPRRLIMAEDQQVAAKLLAAGHKLAYRADAVVEHSHAYTAWTEMRRYFDVGVFHSREGWILDLLGAATRQGRGYAVAEFLAAIRRSPMLGVRSLLRSGAKLTGYRLGLSERIVPLAIKRRLSLHRHFWNGRAHA